MEFKQQAHLSKTILEMKFMKKSKERVQKENEIEQSQSMYSNEITEEMKKSGNIVFVETGIVNCKNLIEGRLSFGGMNPELEKLMKNDYTQELEEAEKLKEKDISDIEMAKGYSTVIDTISKKFKRKNKKFLKPSTDF